MSATQGKGGASPLVWLVLGLVLGLAGGWWYDSWVAYPLLGTILGWLTGLSLADAGSGNEH